MSNLNPEHTQKLLQKYNVPVPRYTSYPTVPQWSDRLKSEDWAELLRGDIDAGYADQGISLYIHLPFCESLCTYCGCNKRITSNHGVEGKYIQSILKEWETYVNLFEEKPLIKELHLGGGTPTFFSPGNLKFLIESLLGSARLHSTYEFSFEGHPNNTGFEHLQVLFQLGFRRLSLGVQDNDPVVQKAINRIQPFENVMRVTEQARKLGYRSVNFDLIYGLPFQSLQSIESTVNEVASIRPERVAFYSYAHVPWTSRAQRLFDEHDLPAAEEKMKLYSRGREIFLQNGYSDIGMDHFSLPSDDLYLASSEGRLHRNFMGYSTQSTAILIGLGMSAIGSCPSAYAQNAKALQDYYQHVATGKLPIEKGVALSAEDRRFGGYILDISCRGRTVVNSIDRERVAHECMPYLKVLEEDTLIEINANTIQVSAVGRNFIRNICSAFDLYLPGTQKNQSNPLFSKAI